MQRAHSSETRRRMLEANRLASCHCWAFSRVQASQQRCMDKNGPLLEVDYMMAHGRTQHKNVCSVFAECGSRHKFIACSLTVAQCSYVKAFCDGVKMGAGCHDLSMKQLQHAAQTPLSCFWRVYLGFIRYIGECMYWCVLFWRIQKYSSSIHL